MYPVVVVEEEHLPTLVNMHHRDTGRQVTCDWDWDRQCLQPRMSYLMDLDISVCLDNMLTSTAIGHHHHIKQGVHQKLVFSSIKFFPSKVYPKCQHKHEPIPCVVGCKNHNS